jgi:hypothetical protein
MRHHRPQWRLDAAGQTWSSWLLPFAWCCRTAVVPSGHTRAAGLTAAADEVTGMKVVVGRAQPADGATTFLWRLLQPTESAAVAHGASVSWLLHYQESAPGQRPDPVPARMAPRIGCERRVRLSYGTSVWPHSLTGSSTRPGSEPIGGGAQSNGRCLRCPPCVRHVPDTLCNCR